MTDEMEPVATVRAEDGPGMLAEAGRDLQGALEGFMGSTAREWRALLDDLQKQYERAAWKPQADREQLQGLLGFTRSALDAFERLGREGPPKQDHLTPADFDWHDVAALMRHDEADARALVERIKQTAGDELAVRRAGGRAVEGYHARPIDWAEYLAVWEALADGLRPATGTERLLVDAMAQALVLHRRWLARMAQADSLEAIRFERSAKARGEYEPPRLSGAETVDRAALLADRFQRQFLRLLKAYRDQRRLFGTLVVAGGQVNIAADGGQQVVANRAVPGKVARPTLRTAGRSARSMRRERIVAVQRVTEVSQAGQDK